MSQSNYPLRLQSSLLNEVRKLAQEEGASVNQFINVAVAEKLSAMRLEREFRERIRRANVPAALTLLERLGGEPPRPGDELFGPEAGPGRRTRGARRARGRPKT